MATFEKLSVGKLAELLHCLSERDSSITESFVEADGKPVHLCIAVQDGTHGASIDGLILHTKALTPGSTERPHYTVGLFLEYLDRLIQRDTDRRMPAESHVRDAPVYVTAMGNPLLNIAVDRKHITLQSIVTYM